MLIIEYKSFIQMKILILVNMSHLKETDWKENLQWKYDLTKYQPCIMSLHLTVVVVSELTFYSDDLSSNPTGY